MSTLWLNLLPVVLLWALWESAVVPTDKWQALPADDHFRKFLGIAGAATAAPSIFAVIRFYHAFVASEGTKKWIYAPDELKEFGNTMQGSNEPERPFFTHFVPGIFYLVWWGGIAWCIKEYLVR